MSPVTKENECFFSALFRLKNSMALKLYFKTIKHVTYINERIKPYYRFQKVMLTDKDYIKHYLSLNI